MFIRIMNDAVFSFLIYTLVANFKAKNLINYNHFKL